jgi:hypothetical protein
MHKIEINIDRGYGEKKFIISDKKITTDPNIENKILDEYKPEFLIIAANGNFEPPFYKGSPILRDLREHDNLDYSIWKMVMPLSENENNFFKILDFDTNLDLKNRKDWGVWLNTEGVQDGKPSILVFNYPMWEIKARWIKNGKDKKWIQEILSNLYRIIFSTVDSLKINRSDSIKNIVISDIGGTMLNENKKDYSIQSIRINVFSEVITNWLGKSIEPSSVILTFGEGINNEMLLNAWGEQADNNIDNESEFGEALKLRANNSEICKRMLNESNTNAFFKRLSNSLSEAIIVFGNQHVAVATDLIQTRALTEGMAAELAKYFDVFSGNTLFSYVDNLEKSKKISPWITSYLHVLRQLGNEAAHYKGDSVRRPEKPVGKDLIVIHAALNRILTFTLEELAKN